jgi:hypothetical protein
LPWLAFYAHGRKLGATYTTEQNDRLEALLDTADLGWWWPYTGVAILTDRPVALHRDPQGRLHHPSEAAVAYADGWAIHAWHGTRVPPGLILGEWSTENILREPNAEVRRCAIERMGWPEFIKTAGLKQIGRDQPDPGNPGHSLALYEVPEQIYDQPVRVLVCTNGTVERDGTRRSFGLTVPARCATPVEAAAWGYGLSINQYAQLARRT